MNTRSFLKGFLTGLAATLIIGGLLVPLLGVFNMSASASPGFLDWWGHRAWESSLNWRTPNLAPPTSASLEEGLTHYRSSCLGCHGAPDVPKADWAFHMLPSPPDLWGAEVQARHDDELFYIIREGVRMTGMPGFGAEHDGNDIWNLVTVIRQLEQLSPEQKESLRQAREAIEHRHPASTDQ